MRRPCRGQALTECLVVCAVLVPLLLLIPVIGKLQDVSHATRLASRDAAFAATVAPPAAGDPADLVRARHFGAPGLPVRSGQRPSDDPPQLDPLWTDPHGTPWLRPAAVRVTYGANGSASPTDGFVAARDGLLFGVVPTARARDFGLQARGVFVAEVTAPLGRLPEGVRAWQPFDTVDLAPRSRTALLVDGWAAPSPQAVSARIDAFAPVATALHDVAGGVAGLGVPLLELGRLPAPAVGDGARWRDAVPADRLRPWRAAP